MASLYFDEENLNCEDTPASNIQQDSFINSAQESALNKTIVIDNPSILEKIEVQDDQIENVSLFNKGTFNKEMTFSEEEDTNEPSILDETIEFHDDFESEQDFMSEAILSKCESAKANNQMVEQALLYTEEQEYVVPDFYGRDASLGNFPTLTKVDKNELLNSTARCLPDLAETKNLSESSLEILPHLLNEESSSSESLIYNPPITKKNLDAMVHELNQRVSVSAEVDISETSFSNISFNVSLSSKSNKSPALPIQNFPKYASTPKNKTGNADDMNEDLYFRGFRGNKKLLKNKKWFELMLKEKNAKNSLSTITDESSTFTDRKLNVTSNKSEIYDFSDNLDPSCVPIGSSKELETLSNEKKSLDFNYSHQLNINDAVNMKLDSGYFFQNIDSDCYSNAVDFHSQEEISQGQDNVDTLCDVQKLLNSTVVKNSDLIENEAGSLFNTLNATYSKDLETKFETLTLKEPENLKKLSFERDDPNKTAPLNITYEKDHRSSELVTDSKTSQHSLQDEGKEAENIKTSQIFSKSKLKKSNSCPITNPVSLRNKLENKYFSSDKETSVRKSLGRPTKSKVLAERENKQTGKYNFKENNSNILNKNKDFNNFSLQKNINKTLNIDTCISDKSMTDKYNLEDIVETVVNTPSLDPNECGPLEKYEVQDCQESSVNLPEQIPSKLKSKPIQSGKQPSRKIPAPSMCQVTKCKVQEHQESNRIPKKISSSRISTNLTASKKSDFSSVKGHTKSILLPDVHQNARKSATSKKDDFLSVKDHTESILLPDVHQNARKSASVTASSNRISVPSKLPSLVLGNRKQTTGGGTASSNRISVTSKLPYLVRGNRKQTTGGVTASSNRISVPSKLPSFVQGNRRQTTGGGTASSNRISVPSNVSSSVRGNRKQTTSGGTASSNRISVPPNVPSLVCGNRRQTTSDTSGPSLPKEANAEKANTPEVETQKLKNEQ